MVVKSLVKLCCYFIKPAFGTSIKTSIYPAFTNAFRITGKTLHS